ncbi:MAG TPA: hypothetical protein VK826_18740 [Bacteroidia bacterium]|nr:hypothetical protein [Bacteroidia bacterium]
MKTFLLCLSLIAYTGIKGSIVSLTITNLNQPSQSLVLSGCDTLEIINTSGFTDYFATDTLYC